MLHVLYTLLYIVVEVIIISHFFGGGERGGGTPVSSPYETLVNKRTSLSLSVTITSYVAY